MHKQPLGPSSSSIKLGKACIVTSLARRSDWNYHTSMQKVQDASEPKCFVNETGSSARAQS